VQPTPDDPPTPSSPELDAGPSDDEFIFDASTIPTSEYVRGWDAAAAEAERGSADEDGGPDAH
jgi:hypothetical protein